jgi:hypothetical protein
MVTAAPTQEEAVGHGSDHETPTITVIVKIDQKRCGADAQDRVRLHVLFDWPFRQRDIN